MKEAESHSEATALDNPEERELCPNCLTGNVEGSNFCSSCGGPLSAYAAIGPWEHIFAEGHIYRKATEHPNRFIIVLGIWVIFGPVALIGLGLAFFEEPKQHLLQKLFFLGLVTVSIIVIFKTTRNYVRQRRSRQGMKGGGDNPQHIP